MQITTKFSLGDAVFPITLKHGSKWRPCEVCDGTGKADIKGQSYRCPACGGNRGNTMASGIRFVPAGLSVIGKVDVELYEQEYADEFGCSPRGVKYMLRSTGVGSGTCWHEADLFPTAEEAQAACDKRNQEMAAAGVSANLNDAVQWLRKEGLR